MRKGRTTDLNDREWAAIAPMIPPDRGRSCRPCHDSRTVIGGILWKLATGKPWRDVPERYGKWNSVFMRHRRWRDAGIWEPVESAIRALRGVRAVKAAPFDAEGGAQDRLRQAQERAA